MSEARELLGRVHAILLGKIELAIRDGHGVHAATCMMVADAICRALTTKTEPEAMPELPDWLRREDGDEWCIRDEEGYESYYRFPNDLTDLGRIAEACRILAARERARRAGS